MLAYVFGILLAVSLVAMSDLMVEWLLGLELKADSTKVRLEYHPAVRPGSARTGTFVTEGVVRDEAISSVFSFNRGIQHETGYRTFSKESVQKRRQPTPLISRHSLGIDCLM